MAPTSQMRAAARARAAGGRRGLRVGRARAVRARAVARAAPACWLRQPRSRRRGGARLSSRPIRRRRASSSTGGRTARRTTSPSAERLLSAIVSGPVERRGLPARRRAARLLVPPAAPGAAARLRPRARRRPCTVDPDRHVERAPHARGNARRGLRRGLRGGWQRRPSTPTRGGDRERREQREQRADGEQADADPEHGVELGADAQLGRDAARPRPRSSRRRASLPSSGSHSSVCSPAPDAEATQNVCSPGGPAGWRRAAGSSGARRRSR